MENTKYETYLIHQKGLTLLWFWMLQWQELKGCKYEKNYIKLSPLVSQRFVLGAKKQKVSISGHTFFLGFQNDEYTWMKRIPWKKCVFDPDSHYLYLISNIGTSPDEYWPDIPSVVIAFYIDNLTKFDKIQNKKIDLRNIWWDEEDVFHVEIQPFSSLKMQVGPLNEYFNESEQKTKTLEDIVRDQLNQTNVYMDPGYEGHQVSLDTLGKEFKQINENFKGYTNEKDLIEFNHPELFSDYLYGKDKKSTNK